MSKLLSMMMKEKVEYMPLTVVGSPNITDGVVSGFSSSDYVKMSQPLDTSNPFEFVLKINTKIFVQFGGLLQEDTATTFKSRVQTTTSGTFRLMLSSENVSWDIADITSEQSLSTNTDYFLKFVFSGTHYILSISSNGTIYEDIINISSSAKLRQLPYIFGCNTSNQRQFGGSIDFNNSCLIQNGKKYLFQLS